VQNAVHTRQSNGQKAEVARTVEASRPHDDKLSALKNYHHAKGLCFTCGERWAKDHKCQAIVQLHVVQELVECMQSLVESLPEAKESIDNMELMHLSVDDKASATPERSIILSCTVQGKSVVFLLDSSSSNSFIAKLWQLRSLVMCL